MALGFDIGVKRKKQDNEVIEKEGSQDEKIVVVPEHLDVKRSETGQVLIEEIPEEKNLVVQAKPLNNYNDVWKEPKVSDTEEVSDNEEAIAEEEISHDELVVKEVKEPVLESDSQGNVKVPISFDKWYNTVDHSLSVRKAYKLIDDLETDQPEVYNWVEENEDDFAKIWLGQVSYVVKEIPIYNVTIENKGKHPNMLAKEADGAIILKPYALLDEDDITELTEEEIQENWNYLFDNGYARLLNEDKI